MLVGINANMNRMGQAHFPIKTCSFAVYSWDIQIPFFPLSVNLWPEHRHYYPEVAGLNGDSVI